MTSTSETNKKEVVQIHDEDVEQPGCGILGRYPILSVLGFAAIGIAIGVGLSFWEPEDMTNKDVALQWLGVVGDLFIRALKCIVLPLVFINVIISVVEMMTVGKAGSVGWKTICLYLLTTVFACLLGIFSSLMFKGLYTVGEFTKSVEGFVTLGCDTEGEYLTEMGDGNVACSANYTDESQVQFLIDDVNAVFVAASKGAADGISLSDTVYYGVFTKLVTDNIVQSFTTANFAAVVFFAIFFGCALSKVMDKKGNGPKKQPLMDLLEDIDGCLLIMINWVIMATPFAVMSLIIKAVGGQEDLGAAFGNVGWLVVCTMVAMALQYLLCYVGMFALFTRTNPFGYLKHIVPAQTMAFACASSAATIPVTLKSVIATGRVPETIARFVVPLGATVNMDGGAIYFPCACIWLAILNGIQPSIASYILLVIISTIGSVGTAPVPSASLVLIITAYNTVFNTTGTPDGFSFILAIDWFMDRLRTTLNVTGDTIVTGMVSHLCPLEAGEALEEEVVAKSLSESEEGSSDVVGNNDDGAETEA